MSLSRLAASRFRLLIRNTLIVAVVGGAAACAVMLGNHRRTARTTARLLSAQSALEGITTSAPSDDLARAAIAWGYLERLRLGLESPFRLMEAAARDPRLTVADRRTVSWALLGRVLEGRTHEIDAAALDLLGPWEHGRSVGGEAHLALIQRVVSDADNPRAGELAVRIAYTLASAERLVDGSAPLLAAEAAALIADREIARREAKTVVSSTRGADPIAVVHRRRGRREFYVERPVLMVPDREIERSAVELAAPVLDTLRRLRPSSLSVSSTVVSTTDSLSGHALFAPRLHSLAARVPPTAAMAVTVQRYLPLIRTVAASSPDRLSRARNPEMLVAALAVPASNRVQRRAKGRLLLAAAVSMRSVAQEPVWFEGDTASRTLVDLSPEAVTFDADVPRAWRPYFLASFGQAVRDARRVFPSLALDGIRVRFRMSAPADSALAMHDPRNRTLHLPVSTAAGTLGHELAHDLDRQNARVQGLAGYRSDNVARAAAGGQRRASGPTGRVAASLLALTDQSPDNPRRALADRPAEIFATRVDWFVARALARQGISNGFLSAVQDEILTGHVVHPDRLRPSGNTRSLLTALEGMTSVAPFAAVEDEPGVETLLRWVLTAPVDRRVAAEILRGEPAGWRMRGLAPSASCGSAGDARLALVRLAAESRARGWLRWRARSANDSERAPWARAFLGQAPWSPAAVEHRAAELGDHILLQLGSSVALATGLTAQAAPLAIEARCARFGD